MKVVLPRSIALKIADYLEKDASELHASFFCHGEGRVTPRKMRLEVERVTKWVAQIREAAKSR